MASPFDRLVNDAIGQIGQALLWRLEQEITPQPQVKKVAGRKKGTKTKVKVVSPTKGEEILEGEWEEVS